MRYDESSALWHVYVKTSDDSEETVTVNAVISAVGLLNRPSLPDIEGLDSFAVPLFHSAHWQHEVDLKNKRVAVIGTGCSAVQLLPKLRKWLR